MYQVKPGVFMKRAPRKREYRTPLELTKDLQKLVSAFYTIHKAAYHGKLEELKQGLSAKQADPESIDESSGNTILILAAANGHHEIVQYMCTEVKVNVDQEGSGGLTALHHAAYKGDTRTTQTLLEAKANIQAQDATGNTALHYSCKAGHVRATDMLVKAGALVDQHNTTGITPAIMATINDNRAIITALAKWGANLDQQDKKGNTCLHYACMFGYAAMVKMLITVHHCNAGLKNKEGQTPQDIAQEAKNQSVIQALHAK